MKKIFKSRFFLVVITVIICISVTTYAAIKLQASEIGYKDGNVETALNDLYKKANKTATQVATLTTPGATYTMQNDGYIIGTAGNGTNRDAAVLYLDESPLVLAQWDDDNILRNVSVYANRDTVVMTKSNGANYNLTVYEWK